MAHFELLIAEYLELQGFLVKRNTKVGRLGHGGWSMELDVVGYHPVENRIEHYEPSIDAQNWVTREARYAKKFENGRQFILKEMFPWLPVDTELVQIAIFPSRPRSRTHIAGGEVLSIDEMMSKIRTLVAARGPTCRNATPEQFPLLRVLQLDRNGYSRVVTATGA